MKMPIAAVLLFVSTAALGQPVFNNPPSSGSGSGSGDVVGPASACSYPSEDPAPTVIALMSSNTLLECSLLAVSGGQIRSIEANLTLTAETSFNAIGSPVKGHSVYINAESGLIASGGGGGAAEGGDVSITAGSADAGLEGGDADGGSVYIQPGSGTGGGSSGDLVLTGGNFTSSAGFTIKTASGSNGTIDFSADGSGLVRWLGLPLGLSSYGGVYVSSAGGTAFVLDASAGTFEKFSTFTAGTCSSDVTCSATSDDITMSVAGVYLANFSCSFNGGNNDAIAFELYKEGVAQSNCVTIRTLGAAAAIGSASFNCIVSAAANDSFDIRADNQKDGDDVTMHYCNLTMNRIGS